MEGITFLISQAQTILDQADSIFTKVSAINRHLGQNKLANAEQLLGEVKRENNILKRSLDNFKNRWETGRIEKSNPCESFESL